MKLILLAALVAVALARIPSSSWEEDSFSSDYELKEESFQANREYIFQYNGQVATGIPGSSKQHSATQIQAKVSLIFKQDEQVLLNIRRIRVGKLNEEISNPRAMVPFISFQSTEITSQQEKQLKLPVQFQYTQGIISDIDFDGEESEWSANIKRGILNLVQINMGKRFQVDLQEEHIIGDPHLQQSRQNQKMDFFTAMEKTIQGDCKTHYSIVSDQSRYLQQEKGQVLNVTRTVDFEQCEQRPEMKYNFRFQDPCTRCDQRLLQNDEKFLRSSSITRYGIRGNQQRFVIESAVLESQYQVVPFNNQGNIITTYVNQTLQLKYSGPIENSEQQIRQPSNVQQSQSGMVFSLDWDEQRERFFMQGQEQQESPLKMRSTPENLQQLLRPLIASMRQEVKAEVPEMYLRLVRFIGFSGKQQLKTLFQQFVHSQPESFSQEEHQKIKLILIDALADAGTKDSISYLLQLIVEKQITPLRASLVLKQLINAPLPSQQIVREYLRFLQQPIVQQNWILKQSAYLTLGSLVQGVCMPSEDKLAVLQRGSQVVPRRQQPNQQLCPQELQKEILEKLFAEFENQDSEEEYENKILILKTIGNMGLPLSVQRLEKIIKETEQRQNLLVRMESIAAFRQLRDFLPRTVHRVLMPVFMNTQQPNQLRMAAVYQILQTLPERSVLDQIARKLFSERSEQVASFVYSYMYTVANTTNPCQKSFGRDLQLSLRHGRKISGAFKPQYSKFLHTSAYSRKFLSGLDLNLATMISNRTFIPQSANLNLHSRFLGFWTRYLVQFGAVQENVESLFTRFMRRTEFSDISMDDILSQSPRAQTAPMKELKQLWKQLKTVARQLPTTTPKGYMYLKLKDQEFFMLPASQKTLKQLPSLQELKRTFIQGKHINFQKAALLHSVYYKIPTTIGMPLNVAIWVPAATQLQGQIRIETQNPFKLMLNNVKPSVAVQVITRMEMWNPFSSNGVQIKAKAKSYLPFSTKLTLDAKARQPSIKMSLELDQQQQEETEWLKLETTPYTFTKQNIQESQRKAQNKEQLQTIIGEEWNRVNNVRKIAYVQQWEKYIQNVLGIRVRAEGLWHHTQITGPTYLPVCPFSGPNHLRIVRQQAEDGQEPKEFVVKMTIPTIQLTESNIQGEQIQFNSWDDEEQFQSQQIKPAKGIQTLFKTEMYTKGAEQDRRAQVQTQVKCTHFLRLCKLNSQVTVQPIPHMNRRQVKMCLNAQTQLPESANKFQELRGKQAFAQLKATWGQEQCQQENVIEIKLNAQHSQQQQQYQQEQQSEYQWNEQEEDCQEQSAMCTELGMKCLPQQLLKYNLHARYQNVPVAVKNATNKALQFVKNHYYWNVDTMNFLVRNQQNVIKAQLTLDTRTKQFFNATIKTPIENITVTDAELPIPVTYPLHIRKPNAIRSFANVVENFIRPVIQQCYVNGKRVETFDEVNYRAPLSDCYTLLAKDCQDESNPSYAILMKKLNPETEQKQMKIISYQHKIILYQRSKQDPIVIKINGQQVQQMSDLPFTRHLQVEKSDDEQVMITLPQAGIKVIFDGCCAKIEMSPMMQSQQCGICGHYNQEQRDEFYTPQNQRVQDIRKFIQAYTIKSDSCQYPEELEQISQSQNLRSWISESSSSQSRQQQKQQPIQRPIVEQHGSKICFSLQTYKQCPKHSHPVQYGQENQKVVLRCIDEEDVQVHRFQRIARHQRRIPEQMKEILEQSERQIETYIDIPSQCKQTQQSQSSSWDF